MIVPMKKIYVFFVGGSKEQTEKVSLKLRDIGALHIEASITQSQYRADINKALNILNRLKKQPQTSGSKDAAFYVKEILSLDAEKKQQQAVLKELERVQLWYKTWGSLSLSTIKQINDGSVFINLYNIKTEDFDPSVLDDDKIFILAKTKTAVRLMQVSFNENTKLEGIKKEPLPAIDISELPERFKNADSKIEAIDSRLSELAGHVNVIKDAIAVEDKKLELEAVRKRGIRGVDVEGVACVEAFIPADKIADFEKSAEANGWGVSQRDPVPEDDPPTLLKSPKIIQPVHALYDIIGLNTGYYEADVSFIFYLFFIVFTALLLGDAGYGSLFLLLTLFGHIKSKNPDLKLLTLGYVLSTATITWGALIGNWFGSETIAGLPFIQRMTIPALASFDLAHGGLKDSTNIMMRISFGIAIIHLTLAHLISFGQKIKSLDAIGQLAWIGFLAGIYMLLGNLIFKDELHPYFMHQMVVSMILILLFSDTTGGIVNGIKSTALTAPFDFIGGLSDVASYLRLFAVGTAALMLASVFNNLAEGTGIFAPFIILIGHAFNIVLALFGVFVHATRLETVEFSNHAQLEWAGKKYKPFKV